MIHSVALVSHVRATDNIGNIYVNIFARQHYGSASYPFIPLRADVIVSR